MNEAGNAYHHFLGNAVIKTTTYQSFILDADRASVYSMEKNEDLHA